MAAHHKPGAMIRHFQPLFGPFLLLGWNLANPAHPFGNYMLPARFTALPGYLFEANLAQSVVR